MSTHDLKCWLEPFCDVWNGDKRHEIRKADRDYQKGDYLCLHEYDPTTDVYSGRWLKAEVHYLTRAGTWGLPDTVCVMSIKVTERHLAVEARSRS